MILSSIVKEVGGMLSSRLVDDLRDELDKLTDLGGYGMQTLGVFTAVAEDLSGTAKYLPTDELGG